MSEQLRLFDHPSLDAPGIVPWQNAPHTHMMQSVLTVCRKCGDDVRVIRWTVGIILCEKCMPMTRNPKVGQ